MFDLKTGQQLRKFSLNEEGGTSIESSYRRFFFGRSVDLSGNHVLIGSAQGEAHLFDRDTGQELYRFGDFKWDEVVSVYVVFFPMYLVSYSEVSLSRNHAMVGSAFSRGRSSASGITSAYDLVTGKKSYDLIPNDGCLLYTSDAADD